MVDPYTRIQQHLGAALRKLSLFGTHLAAGHETARDESRCVADLEHVANELNQAFDALKLERQRLVSATSEADAAMRRARELFARSPSACVVLHREGAAIAEANAAASRLLNMSQRHLIGKAFTNFLQQDREVFLHQLQQGDGVPDQWHVTLRPRERALVRVRVNPIVDNHDTAALVLSPAVSGASLEDATPYAES
jgi:PAS domain-containing protein